MCICGQNIIFQGVVCVHWLVYAHSKQTPTTTASYFVSKIYWKCEVPSLSIRMHYVMLSCHTLWSQVVVCTCTLAWSGDFCETDRDGCEDDPCFPGITCVDAIAPLEGNTCGPCPDGLVGDGFKCYGEHANNYNWAFPRVNAKIDRKYKLMRRSLIQRKTWSSSLKHWAF